MYLVEKVLHHPDTKIYDNAIGQNRFTIFGSLNNRGSESDYIIPNHAATFECKPKLYKHNHFITQYKLRNRQVEKFDEGMETITMYEDELGVQQTNVSPVFDKEVEAEPTTAPNLSEPDL